MNHDVSNTTNMLMKVKINKMNSNWTMNAVLFKVDENKIFVYSDERMRIEFHFPKDLYYYEKMEVVEWTKRKE
jgi:hypothetical protein